MRLPFSQEQHREYTAVLLDSGHLST